LGISLLYVECLPGQAGKERSRHSGSWESFASANYAPALAVGWGRLWVGGGGVRSYDPATGRWRSSYTEDGLPSNAVNDLAGDEEQGVLWVATSDGAARFDPASGSWTPFTFGSDPNLNHLESVAVQRRNPEPAVWFGSRSGTLIRIAASHLPPRLFPLPPGDPARWIRALAVDPRTGWLWCGTDSGVRTFDPAGERWRTITPQGWVNDVLLDAERREVWVATATDGVQRYDLDSCRRTSVTLPGRAGEALALARDRESLWVGTSEGLFRRSLPAGPWQRFQRKEGLPHPVVSALVTEASSGTVWAATGRGMARFDRRRQRWVSLGPPQQLVHNDINDMVLDSPGNTLWFGTDGGGVSGYRRDTGGWQTLDAEDGLPSNQVRSLEWQADARRLWIGTFAHGAAALPAGGQPLLQLHTAQGLPSDTVSAIAWDPARGQVWLGMWGSDGGLACYDLRTGMLRTFTWRDGLVHPSVTSLALDGGRWLWVGTGGGVSRFDRSTGAWRSFTMDDGLVNNAVLTVTVDPVQEAVWFTTENGMSRYDRRQDRWQSWNVADGLVAPVAISLALQGPRVWLGTEGFGVQCLDPQQGPLAHFTTADGLASNTVLSILVDPSQQELWFGTLGGGASRYRPSPENLPSP